MQILGILLLIGGIILVVLGLQQSRGISDRAARMFLGRFTQQTMLFLIGGGVLIVIGLALAVI